MSLRLSSVGRPVSAWLSCKPLVNNPSGFSFKGLQVVNGCDRSATWVDITRLQVQALRVRNRRVPWEVAAKQPGHPWSSRSFSSSARVLQVKAAAKVKTDTSSTVENSRAASAKELVTDDASKVSEKEQSLTDWKIIKRLAVNIWPKGEWEIKVRVAGALGLLVAGKVSSCSFSGL